MFEPGVEHFLDSTEFGPPKAAHFVETAADCVRGAVHIRKMPVQFSQLIAESADEKTFWTGTEQRRHRSPAGNTIGVTREKKRFWTGTPYRETTRTDGTIKSASEEKKHWLTNKKYTESTGGTSNTTHQTRTRTIPTGA